MKRAITVAAVFLWVGVSSVRAEEVVLRLDGIHSDTDADAIKESLAKVESVKFAITPTKEKPEMRIAFDLKKADVGELARAIGDTKTPNRDKGAPSATLVLAYARLDGAALGDELYLPNKVEPAFAKLAGVEPKKCSIDFKKQRLLIKLDDKGGAKLADIKKGFGGLMLTTP